MQDKFVLTAKDTKITIKTCLRFQEFLQVCKYAAVCTWRVEIKLLGTRCIVGTKVARVDVCES